MTLTLPDVLVAVILFTCVPLQYIVVQNWGNKESNRSYVLHSVLNHLRRIKEDYLEWKSWKRWFVKLLNIEHLYPVGYTGVDSDPDSGESPAIEVIRYKHKHGYFSFSPDPRTSRPPSMKFRVGQVVVHKKWKYRGVIIGWDEVAKAPSHWLDEMHGEEHKVLREMPNYSILVDTRDRLSPQLTYVPEVHLDAVKNTKVIHPLIDDHFESYDGAQYIARPWLKSLYPQD